MSVPSNTGGYSSQQMVLAKINTCQQENLTHAQRIALGQRKVTNPNDFHVQRLRESILNALTEQQKAVLVTLPMEKRRAFIKTYVEVCGIDPNEIQQLGSMKGKYSKYGFWSYVLADFENWDCLFCKTQTTAAAC